jgi:glycerol-3-phosphate dehydrogenase
MTWRNDILQDLKADPNVSVLILGGGINGVGLLRELALQDVDCLLVDKADFVAGASSKSSRMIHGGLRYLENREFRLVRESLIERNRLLAAAAHYVSPERTTIPLFSWLGGFLRSGLIFMGFPVRPGSRGALPVKVGLWFYDFVTRKNRRTPRHYFTSRAESLRTIPGLHPGIVATATYWDAKITQAERLCIELIHDARAANPFCRAINYVRPVGVENDAVILADETSGQAVAVRPRIVVNATGAWVDKTNAALGLQTRYMGGTKGSHLVVDCPELLAALGDQLVYYQHADGRVCIVFTFMGKVIMGSTDIRVDDPDTAACDAGEVDYMMTTLRNVFPDVRIPREKILFNFCGVRPLPAENKSVLANVTRGHAIEVVEPAPGRPFPLFCLIGGKWTTFRAFGEQVADRLLPRLGVARRCATQGLPIGGGKNFPAAPEGRNEWVRLAAQASGLAEDRVAVLLERYGTAAEAYARKVGVGGEQPLQSLPSYTVNEVAHILETEYVEHLGDLVYRRSVIGLLGDARPEVLRELAAIAGRVLGWDAAREEQEVRLAAPPEIGP